MVVAAPHEYKIRWEAIEISPETVDLFQEIEDGFEAAGVYTKHLWDLYNHQNRTIKFRYPLPIEADSLGEAFDEIWSVHMHSRRAKGFS